jgi:hypothetical protein
MHQCARKAHHDDVIGIVGAAYPDLTPGDLEALVWAAGVEMSDD